MIYSSCIDVDDILRNNASFYALKTCITCTIEYGFDVADPVVEASRRRRFCTLLIEEQAVEEGPSRHHMSLIFLASSTQSFSLSLLFSLFYTDNLYLSEITGVIAVAVCEF